ncbi:MAG: HEPN domain-containing protein [Bacteroidota bacterium]|nr:DNA-binding protein [Odoribacter sp.]MDP3642106.1 HEPN domain-containing protein [Bacteroidota bacterium]
MINILKQIDYWQKIAESDIDTASILVSSGKYVEGMFFCHLCIEKIIKALVVKQIGDIPPKSHDLFYIANLAKIDLDVPQSEFIQILMKYQLEGRYPEYFPKAPSPEKINEYLCLTKNLYQCFNKML